MAAVQVRLTLTPTLTLTLTLALSLSLALTLTLIRYTPEDVPTLRQAPLLLAALALSFEHPATGEQASRRSS